MGRIRLVAREKIGGADYAVFHPQDTFGIMIELVEYKEKHPTVSAGGR